MRMRMIIIYFNMKINTIFRMRYILFITCFALSQFFLANCEKSLDSSKIVIAGGSLTEIVYFLDYSDKIAGIDVTSNYPSDTANLPSIGYVRALSTEGILSLKPSLILGEDDMGPPLVIDQLELTGVDLRIIDEGHSANGILQKINCISSVLGVDTNLASSKIELLEQDINKLNKLAMDNQNSKIKVMLILNMQGTSPIVAGKGTSGDGFIKMTGALNVADNFEGWKPISSESIISYNPDFIIITNRGMGSFPDTKGLSETTALRFTDAAKEQNILSEDGMAMLGFGVRTIAAALKFAETFQQ